MIVIARNFGQLGNRLLLSAHLIAAAREYGVTLWNPSFAEYAQFFQATRRDLWCRYPAHELAAPHTIVPDGRQPPRQEPGNAPSAALRKVIYGGVYYSGKLLRAIQCLGVPVPVIRLVGDQSCDLASESFRRLAQSRLPLLVSGWRFRSRPLLAKHASAIREHFEILPEHRQRVRQLMHLVRQCGKVVVGVHIRHGDYAKFENGRYLYNIGQYSAAMRRIRDELGGDVVFLVCGNTKLNRDDFGDLNVRFGTGHLVEDMYSFAATDFLIGPPSTYTGWASFYGDVPLQFMETAEESFDLSRLRSGHSVLRAS